MSMYTTQHILISGVNRKLKDNITESDHFLVAETHAVNGEFR